MRLNRRRVGLSLLLVIGLLILSGCGGSDGEASDVSAGSDQTSTDSDTDSTETDTTDDSADNGGESTDDEADSEADATDESGENAPDATSPAAGPIGTLRYANYTDTTTFDPAVAAGVMSDYILPVYDTLLSLDSAGEVLPNLATEWELDGLTYTFTLRDDVVFHDGTPFDAEAVKATLDRNGAVEDGPHLAKYAFIDTIEVVDPTHVAITLNSPSPGFLYSMGTIAGAMISPTAIEAGTDLTRAPAGSGGWIWNADESREGSLHVYHANPDYWNPGALGVERLEIHVVPDNNARLNGTETGQYDIAASVPANLIQSASDSGLTVESINNLMLGFVVIDDEGTTVEALGDDRVRQAIGYLINREAFNAAIFAGQGDPVPGGYFNQESEWYDAALSDVYGTSGDVEKAKELLAEAGYADGFTIEAPSLPVVQQPLEAIGQMLAEGGITLEITQVQPGTLSSSMRAGEYPVGIASSTSADPADWFQYQIAPEGPYNPFESSRFVDTAEVEKKAAAATDPAEQKALYDEVQRDVLERGKMFPASFSPTSIAIADTVTTEVMLRNDGAISLNGVRVAG